MMRHLLAVTAVLFSLTVPTSADTSPFTFEFDEIAPGIWTVIRPDGPRFPVMGNATIVIGDKGVVVFDGGGVPAMADQIIEHIQGITAAPVTHVVISHWHGDHCFGIHRFREVYPEVEYVAHEFTSAALAGSPVDYIDRYPTFAERRVPQIEGFLETGLDRRGNEIDEGGRAYYRRILAYADEIAAQYKETQVTQPTISFKDRFVIETAGRPVELLYLGHGNTEGDIVMWLPEEEIVATGDLVVRPTPYAFNVPPRAWVKTLEKLNELSYDKLVPGHGKVQTDTAFVDLIIATATSIADQRDALIAQGLETEAVEAQLDFSEFREKFTGGDSYITAFYNLYFEAPLRKAALKELLGEPMVVIGPRAAPASEGGGGR
jgi:glyoxylase-like metal-dependent hydrolase (beta-lactamase superfamily II)